MSLNPWSSISSTAQEGGGRFRLAGENGSLGHTLKWVFQTPLPVCFLLWIQWDQLIGISATMPCPLQYCNIPYHTLARAQLSRVRGHLACHPHASGEYRVSLGSRIRSLALSSRSSCPPPPLPPLRFSPLLSTSASMNLLCRILYVLNHFICKQNLKESWCGCLSHFNTTFQKMHPGLFEIRVQAVLPTFTIAVVSLWQAVFLLDVPPILLFWWLLC